MAQPQVDGPHEVTTFTSPLGRITLAATNSGLTHVQFGTRARIPEARGISRMARAHLAEASRALQAYFAGRRTEFDDLTLAPIGTPFQHLVWKALRCIPFGTTVTYGQIARRVRRPAAARAVGMANHRNPLAIVVPCHRVIGVGGALTGYGAGLDAKEWLLHHEGVATQ